MELTRKENWMFENYYEETNGNKTVMCILDNWCVRYHVIINNGRKITNKRHEFSNDKKELCFKNATKALNK